MNIYNISSDIHYTSISIKTAPLNSSFPTPFAHRAPLMPAKTHVVVKTTTLTLPEQQRPWMEITGRQIYL